jgi:hypothetical protein
MIAPVLVLRDQTAAERVDSAASGISTHGAAVIEVLNDCASVCPSDPVTHDGAGPSLKRRTPQPSAIGNFYRDA